MVQSICEHIIYFNNQSTINHDSDYEDHDVLNQWSWTWCVWSLTCPRPQAPNLDDDVSPTPPGSPETTLDHGKTTIVNSININHIDHYNNKNKSTTSAITPTQPQITAALAWAPDIPPSPAVTKTWKNMFCQHFLFSWRWGLQSKWWQL